MIPGCVPRPLNRARCRKFLWRNLWIPGDKAAGPGCAPERPEGARIGAGQCVDKYRETKTLATSLYGHPSTIHRPTTTAERNQKKNL